MRDGSYAYDTSADTKYCYPGTHVLINNFNMTDAQALAEAENHIALLSLAALESHPIQGNFDLEHLQKIHRAIFEDIYPWAGKVREGDFLAKGSSVFCRGAYIESYADEIHKQMARENFLRGLKKPDFVKRIAYYMGEVNALHPFREGNGRTQREFFRELALAAGYVLNFSHTTPDRLLQADISAFHGSYEALEHLMDGCLAAEHER